jgi:arylsulfatase A-like enzyme
MRLPGVIPEDKQSQALVEAIDIYPTILDITGYKAPASAQGISLVPVISGKTDKHRDVVRCEYPGASYNGKKARALMQFDGRFKVVDNGTDYPPELYDHKTDPHETKNIGADPKYREMLRKTIEELRAWEKTDPPKPKSNPKSPEEKEEKKKENRSRRDTKQDQNN